MGEDVPCIIGWEKDRLDRSLSAEIEFLKGRIDSAIDNPTDPRLPTWRRRLEEAQTHLEEVRAQPTCEEVAEAQVEDSTPVSPLPAPPQSPDQ